MHAAARGYVLLGLIYHPMKADQHSLISIFLVNYDMFVAVENVASHCLLCLLRVLRPACNPERLLLRPLTLDWS